MKVRNGEAVGNSKKIFFFNIETKPVKTANLLNFNFKEL